MAVRINDLKIHLSSPQISLLRPENAEFLQGARAEPSIGNLWNGWPVISKIVMVLGALVFIYTGVMLLSDWVWDSPLVKEVPGVIDGMDGDTVKYHYTADGVRYDKQEYSREHSDDYEKGDVPKPVVYLKLAPSKSKLSYNVSASSLLMIIVLQIFVAFIPFCGYIGLRSYRKLSGIRDGATHVIEGVIHNELPAVKGSVSYLYRAVSPVTGKTIGNSVQIGRLSPHFGRIGKGAKVAILYQNDKRHTIL